jgi:hypothetical protein
VGNEIVSSENYVL